MSKSIRPRMTKSESLAFYSMRKNGDGCAAKGLSKMLSENLELAKENHASKTRIRSGMDIWTAERHENNKLKIKLKAQSILTNILLIGMVGVIAANLTRIFWN